MILLTRRQRLASSLVLVAIAVLLVSLGIWLEPDARGLGTHEQLGLPSCGTYVTTGAPCPTCGVTTAFAEMIHLDPVRAFSLQPFGALVGLLSLLVPPLFLVGLFDERFDPTELLIRIGWLRIVLVLVGTLFLTWIVRQEAS